MWDGVIGDEGLEGVNVNQTMVNLIKDLDKKYGLSEIVKGDSIFCATGITDSSFIKGITFDQDKYISETLITHKNTNYKQLVKNVNSINE